MNRHQGRVSAANLYYAFWLFQPDDVVEILGIAAFERSIAKEKCLAVKVLVREPAKLLYAGETIQNGELLVNVPVNSRQATRIRKFVAQLAAIKQWLVIMVSDREDANLQQGALAEREFHHTHAPDVLQEKRRRIHKGNKQQIKNLIKRRVVQRVTLSLG
jgi:hypothetical protein